MSSMPSTVDNAVCFDFFSAWWEIQNLYSVVLFAQSVYLIGVLNTEFGIHNKARVVAQFIGN